MCHSAIWSCNEQCRYTKQVKLIFLKPDNCVRFKGGGRELLLHPAVSGLRQHNDL